MFTGDRGLKALLESGVLQQQVSLANYTTWRVGGPAQWLAEPNDAEQCLSLLQWAQTEGLATRVIGAGSNLLIADSGLPGLTLCTLRIDLLLSAMANLWGSIASLWGINSQPLRDQ